jgi:hypothetical protein
MPDTGLTVSGMNEPPSRYHITVTVARDVGYLPDPAEFAVAAEKAASSRNASIMSAHTASQIVSIVTVLAADQPVAVAVGLAVVADALNRPIASSILFTRCIEAYLPKGSTGDSSSSSLKARKPNSSGSTPRCT